MRSQGPQKPLTRVRRLGSPPPGKSRLQLSAACALGAEITRYVENQLGQAEVNAWIKSLLHDTIGMLDVTHPSGAFNVETIGWVRRPATASDILTNPLQQNNR
jgi:hypothetical protein